jgi:putative hydrolase of the HAD superfamily
VIDAVLFDLDDTLYPQATWLEGAWRAVTRAAALQGVDPIAFERALRAIAALGSDRGYIIDRALAAVGAAHVPVESLVAAFLEYRPLRLAPYPGVPEALSRIRRHVPIGLVTDGDVRLQRAKVRALGLHRAFDTIVFPDAFGRQYRKPDPGPFLAALASLGVAPQHAVYVGDRPDKDIAGAQRAGLRAIRVHTGEYAAIADYPTPWATASDVVAAIDGLERLTRDSRPALAAAGGF